MEACVGSVYKIPAWLLEYCTLILKIGRNQTTHYFIVFDGGYQMARYLHDILGTLLAMLKKKNRLANVHCHSGMDKPMAITSE